MRLIGNIKGKENAQKFSAFLQSEGIDNICEVEHDKASIWVFDENDIPLAKQWHMEYLKNPNEHWFTTKRIVQPKTDKFKQTLGLATAPRFVINLTTLILAACIGLFLWGEIETPFGARHMAPSAEALMYDMPENPRHFWRGLYHEVLVYYHNAPEFSYKGQLFEKISEGEYWRLFTPCLLHGSILHLCFNMLWIYILGHQMEERLGIARLALFVIISGIVSNTAQYLMGGFMFVGISGVICGMFTFIWVRMRTDFTEGYQLNRSTFSMLSIFILGVAALQVVSFCLQLMGIAPLPIGIANTAHLTGAVTGYALGRLKFFAAH